MQHITKTRLFIILALMMGLMASAVNAQDAIAVGDIVEAEATDANVDYALSLEAGQAVQIYLLTDDFSSLLELRDGDGNMVAADEESGDDYNDSRIIFVSNNGGDYTLTVAASFGNPEGAYTLSVAEENVPMVGYDETVTTDGAGMMDFYFQMEASAGDVLNIYGLAVSDDDDIRFTVRDMMGVEIARDDDSGSDRNPYIRRMVVPADGVYNIFVDRIFDREMVGAFDITIEQTEALPITAEPYNVTLGGDYEVEVFSLDASSGTTYRLTVVTGSNAADATVDILEPGSDFADSRFNANDFSEITFTFRIRATGVSQIVVDNNTFNELVDFTVSVEAVE